MSNIYPLTTQLIPSTSLSTFPDLSILFNLLNRTYTHSHLYALGYQTFPEWVGRLQKLDQLATEIGPDGFCVVAYSASSKGGKKMIATASAKPYHAASADLGKAAEANDLFKRPLPKAIKKEALVDAEKGNAGGAVDDGRPTWELLATAVDPELQGKGISTQVLDLTLGEIKRRVAIETGKEKYPIRIFLSTMKERNIGYYIKKGWKATEERTFPRGSGGSLNKFTVVDMVRVI